jgi:small subunit ribosomal protein S13
MARIAGVDIPRDKHIDIALTYIYGIGRPTAIKICENAKVDTEKRVRDLTEEELAAIRREVTD